MVSVRRLRLELETQEWPIFRADLVSQLNASCIPLKERNASFISGLSLQTQL